MSIAGQYGQRFFLCRVTADSFSLANERHRNVYGSPGARLQVWQSVRGQVKDERLWLVKYMSPLLFYAPETHLSGIWRLLCLHPLILLILNQVSRNSGSTEYYKKGDGRSTRYGPQLSDRAHRSSQIKLKLERDWESFVITVSGAPFTPWALRGLMPI